MNTRGPYRSREETQRRLLDAGLELARNRPPADPFGHFRTNDLIAAADVSQSAMYRSFGTVTEYHRTLIREVVNGYWDSHREDLDTGFVELMESGPTHAEIQRVLGAASFADLMADEFDNLQVAMAAMCEDETFAELFRETDSRTLEVMTGFYAMAAELMESHPQYGAEYADVAVVNFAIFDGMVMWNKVDPGVAEDVVDGPEGVDVDGPWSLVGVAAWAISEHISASVEPELAGHRADD